MNRKNIGTVAILLVMLTLISACERDEFNWGTKIGNITYSGNVVFLGATELSLIKEITSENIIFTGETGEIKNITDKSILVMGISEKTPYGALRKVSSIQNNKTEIIIATNSATLEEAIKEGTINLQARLLEKDFRIKYKTEGVIAKGVKKSFDGLAVTLDKFEIYNDGARNAILNGAVGISPEVGLNIKIGSNKISEIKLVTTLNKIDELTMVSNGAFGGNNEIIAAEFIHSPIIIDSLVFVPEVVISCGFQGTVSSEVTSGVRQDRSLTSKLSYSKSKWINDQLIHQESFDFIRPYITENSDLDVFSGPEIRILLFGIPVQIVKATGFYSLQAEKDASPLWRLFIGNDGHNTAKADIFGLPADYVVNLDLEPSEIGNANGK
jgi:hypothetical protein